MEKRHLRHDPAFKPYNLDNYDDPLVRQVYELLNKHRMTEAYFSQQTRINKATMKNWRYRGTIQTRTMRTIADFFGCKIRFVEVK